MVQLVGCCPLYLTVLFLISWVLKEDWKRGLLVTSNLSSYQLGLAPKHKALY